MADPIINKQLISIPPYLATRWENVNALYMVGDELFIKLSDNKEVCVPKLSQEHLDLLFQIYANLEKPLTSTQSKPANKNTSKEEEKKPNPSLSFRLKGGPGGVSTQMGIPPIFGNFMGMEPLLQHDPKQAHTPPLPAEILERLKGVSNLIGAEDLDTLPKAEPHCNCPFCQIVRAIHPEDHTEEEPCLIENEGEPVNDDEISFRHSAAELTEEWKVSKESEQLYRVTSVQDSDVAYQVFLGRPIGCTCGSNQCEHIKAVLYT